MATASSKADTKHLEFLQAAISRMAANSFLAKGWSVTLVTALLALAIKDGRHYFTLVAILPVIVFAILDAYYLALERGFRRRFKAAVEAYAAGIAPDFNMSPDFKLEGLVVALFRPAVLLPHGLLALLLIVAYYLVCHG